MANLYNYVMGSGSKVTPKSTLINGLKHYFKMDNATGTSNTDEITPSILNYNGASIVAGRLNYGINCVGTAKPTVNNSTAFDFDINQPYSISFWYNKTGTNADKALFAKRDANGYECYTSNNDTKIIFGLVNLNINRVRVEFTYTIPTNQWGLYVFTYDGTGGNGFNLYVNGVIIPKTVSITGTLVSFSNPAPFKVGIFYNDQFPSLGVIDEVGGWNRVLTPSEINELNNGGSYPFPLEAPFPSINSYSNTLFTADYIGGVVYGDDIYMIPHGYSHLTKFNTITKVASDGSTNLTSTSAKYWGGVISGTKIIAVAHSTQYGASVTIGGATLANKYNVGSSGEKFAGGVIANGYAYLIPFKNTTVSKIRLSNDSVTNNLGTNYGTTNAKWIGGTLANNGMIYCTPLDASNILKINPTNDVTSTFGSFTGGAKWGFSCLAPNGKIYCPPYSSSEILVIDPSNDSTYTFGSFGISNAKWGSATLGPNGKIYCMPRSGTQILEIDPSNDTTRLFGNFPAGGKYFGSVLCNNKIYGIPFTSGNLLELVF